MPVIEDVSLSLRQQVREDWERHNRRSSAPAVHALAVHRAQVRLAGRPGLPARLGRLALHAINILVIRNLYGMELFPSTVIGRRLLIAHHMGVLLGEHSALGDDCIIRQHVTLGQQGDSTYDQPTLGNGVDVGPGATIVGAITVGDGARIGAHALVLRNVPAGATAMTSPARVLPAAVGDKTAVASDTTATGTAAG